MRSGPRWLCRHVEVVAVPGLRSLAVWPRTPAPELSVAVRRRPDAGRVTIEPRR